MTSRTACDGVPSAEFDGKHHAAARRRGRTLLPARATARATWRRSRGWRTRPAALAPGCWFCRRAFLTGPAEDAVSVAERALLSDDPALRDLAAIARAERVAILCGYLEVCTGRQHDSALFVDHRGCALANYRRTHFNSGGDPGPLARGQWLTVVSFADTRLGVLIGADIEAPEPAQALTLAGANILLVLGSHGAEASIVGDAVLPTRAFENACAVAYANGWRVGCATQPVARHPRRAPGRGRWRTRGRKHAAGGDGRPRTPRGRAPTPAISEAGGTPPRGSRAARLARATRPLPVEIAGLAAGRQRRAMSCESDP